MIEQAIALTLAPNQTNQIDVEHQRGFATRLAGLGVEYPGLTKGQLDLVQPVGMLVQQKSVAGRCVVVIDKSALSDSP